MKLRIVQAAVLITVAVTFLMVGNALGSKQSLSKTTNENLSTAMHGEAFAYAKYMLYAEQARQNGNEELAKLFEETAKTERLEHFAEEARLAGLVGGNVENLKDSISGESYEVDTMYRQFAEKASTAGDKSAADLFEEIRRDEMKHRDSYKVALDKIEKTTAPGN